VSDGADLVWLAALAAEVLGMRTEDALRVIDLEALDEVRAAVESIGADTIMQAATLMVETVRGKPLPRQNRRLAVLGATWLLGTCGLELSCSGERLAKLLRAAEFHDAEVDDVHELLFHNVVHQDQKGGRMFERFTDRARKVLTLSQLESAKLGHDFLGTEHLVLAMLAEGEGVGGKALDGLGLTYPPFFARVQERIGGSPMPAGSPAFTPRAKKVLELSLREALKLGHNYIGTEHILLGLVREKHGLAMEILREDFGLEPAQIRDEVIRLLSGHGPKRVEPPPKPVDLVKLYQGDVAALPTLSSEEVASLSEMIQAGIRNADDDPARAAANAASTRLVEGHLRDVLKIVLRMPPGGDVLAQLQEGNLALIKAAATWTPADHGASFAAYLEEQVEAAIDGAKVAELRAGPVVRCTFCNKSQKVVKKLIAGPGNVYICNECIDLCVWIIADDPEGPAAQPTPPARLRCPSCDDDLLAKARVVDATVDATQVRLLVCECGRVIGPA
jgi:hypothetical protein